MVRILTAREMRIINKKVKGLSLTQNESNILSKSVRPKLREIKKLNADALLNRLEYNQIGRAIENKIKKIVLKNIRRIQSIIIYGSAIQSNYKNYNDIDALIITKNKILGSTGDKYDLIIKLSDIAKSMGLNMDIQVMDKASFIRNYPNSPSLIYQLKDHKIIYGKIKIPKKAELSKLDLRMKLDWSDIDDEESKSNEIYQSLRNVLLVRLLLKKIVNNELLNKNVNEKLGERIIANLKNNAASKIERKIVLEYIRSLVERTDKEIMEAKWEKIVL